MKTFLIKKLKGDPITHLIHETWCPLKVRNTNSIHVHGCISSDRKLEIGPDIPHQLHVIKILFGVMIPVLKDVYFPYSAVLLDRIARRRVDRYTNV